MCLEKVIVFGLFEKERRARAASPGPGSAFGSGQVRQSESSHKGATSRGEASTNRPV